MSFHARTDASTPHALDQQAHEQPTAPEKTRGPKPQRAGKRPHLWRIVGRYSNISVLDVDSPDEPPQTLSPFRHIDVSAPAQHSSDLAAQP